jgi:hypothetical protein
MIRASGASAKLPVWLCLVEEFGPSRLGRHAAPTAHQS